MNQSDPTVIDPVLISLATETKTESDVNTLKMETSVSVFRAEIKKDIEISKAFGEAVRALQR